MKHPAFLTALILILLTQCSKEESCTCGEECMQYQMMTLAAELTEEEPEEDLSIFIPDPETDLPVSEFREVWGYVVSGQESALRRGLPITDVCYFGAEVNMYGRLNGVPNRSRLSSSFTGRVHLTVTCPSSSLTYFTLMPGSKERVDLIRNLIMAAGNFDGLNIDFENIPAQSGDAFLSFLRELREGLPAGKMLTIALYGRNRAITNDVYDYAKIAPYVDRIFVMAYDEHWGGSAPGPVSSLRWCASVADYSLRVIGTEKLIMGIPFYGRAWASQNHSRALTYPSIERLQNTAETTELRRENGTPVFDYEASVSVRVYYEDEYSISARMEMYKSMGVKSIGFWRIGQETQKVWSIIKLEV
ncbi:MAG: glycoside hydrolase [Treponema sp.]|jgi:GH18 family chitinase|nr:glycoside hydrolase [Treponema sp.]